MGKKVTQVAVVQKPFAKRLLYLTNSGKHRTWEVWSDFVTMLACTISNRVDREHYDKREELYMNCIKRYAPNEQSVFPDLIVDMVQALEQNPFQDFLGEAYMALELGNDHAGQFFTPYDICSCMARITSADYVSEIAQKGYIKVNDCACGAGATLIAVCEEVNRQLSKAGSLNWQMHTLIFAQDIDYTVALMCYIQLSMIGAAAVIKIGDSLSDPMAVNDKHMENYWFTPMYFHSVWQTRRMLHGSAC